MVTLHLGGFELDIAAQLGGRQVRMHLLCVLDNGDLVVIRTQIGGRVRNGHGNELAELVRPGRVQSGQAVDKLADAVDIVGRRGSAYVITVAAARNGNGNRCDCSCCSVNRRNSHGSWIRCRANAADFVNCITRAPCHYSHAGQSAC